MTTTEALLTEIHDMKNELKSGLERAVNGEIVDISKLPDRLLVLHTDVQKLDKDLQGSLISGLEEILDLLDNLSKEIQKKYEDMGAQIKMLDG